jgi:hypothetical protein
MQVGSFAEMPIIVQKLDRQLERIEKRENH